jgi:Zn-dependent protease
MEIPKKPGQEAIIAFAGPLMSLIIGATCLFTYRNIISPNPVLSQNSFFLIIWILGSMNLVLGIFNLIPAFPMDGGRILRSLFTMKMSYAKATHSAAFFGKFIAVLMALFGLYAGDLWLFLIALYVYGSATNEDRSAQN